MNCKSYDEFFRNFANRTRFEIIMLLRGGPKSVNELSERMKEEQSKVSHSLSALAKCGIVKMKKDGKRRIYSLNKETITPMLSLVGKHVEKNCDGRCCR